MVAWTRAPTSSPRCSRVVGRFRRQLRRSAGRGFDATGLTEAQAELLRLVGRRPDISVREAAAELGLVPNTASTLVSKLASDGLLTRTVDADDRRVGRLRLTESAQHIADASRAAGRAALSEVLDELDAGPDRRAEPRPGGDGGHHPQIAGEARMTPTADLAVDCRHLTHRYGDFTAVDDLTLQVSAGETVGLLGPNGAGKTTVVRVLTTLTPVQAGEVYVFGLDSRRQTMDIRHNIGYVPQQLSIEPMLTGRQNVELVRPALRRAAASSAPTASTRRSTRCSCSTSPTSWRRTYSGGMVRRLELAQALVNRPSLLILDEPTVGLDPIARDGVWAQVADMQAEFGMTVLLTTHYMEEADALCDRVALMHHGGLQAVGTPAELKAQACQPDATLEDVFRHYAGSDLDEETSKTGLREIRSSRRTARRVS